MKATIFSLSFLLFMVGFCKAQGTLQFNRVLIVSNAQTTVPTNKVWKVVSFLQPDIAYTSLTTTYPTCTTGRHSPFLINGFSFYIFEGSGGTGNTSPSTSVGNKLPVWLPAGATLSSGCNNNILSVIEFNISP